MRILSTILTVSMAACLLLVGACSGSTAGADLFANAGKTGTKPPEENPGEENPGEENPVGSKDASVPKGDAKADASTDPTPSCGPALFEAAECETCRKANCCDESVACDDNAECRAILQCLSDNECADTACTTSCVVQHLGGRTDATSLNDCINDQCANECQ